MADFNPILQADVRFNQPVQQPDVFGAVGNILQSVGLTGRQSSGQSLSDNERFDRAVQAFQAQSGTRTPVEQWTPQQVNAFGQFAGPRFQGQLVDLQEQLGGIGRTQERTVRDNYVEYTASPRGSIAAGQAAQLHPNDPQAQEAYVIQSYANENQRIIQHQDLERRSQEAGFRGNINDEAWAIERDNISQMAFQAANVLANQYPQLASGGSFQLSEVAPEVAMMLGYDVTVNQSNFATIATQVRRAMFTGYTQQLRTLYPDQQISAPSEAYLDEVFAPYDDVIEQIGQGVDPTQLLEQANSADELRIRQEFTNRGMPHAMAAFRIAGRLSPQMQEMLLAENLRNISPVFSGFLQGQQVASTQQASEMSAQDRTNFQQVFSTELSEVSRTAIGEQGRAQAFVNRLQSFISVQTESGDRLSPEHYRTIISRNVQTSISAAGEDPQATIASLIQSDMGLEISDLQDAIARVEGGLVYENGQLRYVPSTLVGDDGSTMGARGIPSDAQELLDRVNGKLQVLNSSGTQLPQGLMSTLTTGIGVTAPTESGGGASRTGDQSQQVAAPSALTTDRIISSLAMSESSNNFGASNNEDGSGGQGHFGRLQFSRARLAEAQAAGVMPRGMTPEQFLRDPQVQQAVERWSTEDHIRNIMRTGLDSYIGQSIQGVPITLEGMVAAAHLGGFTGMTRFITSGGQHNPRDTIDGIPRTSLLDYMRQHGGVGRAAGPNTPIPRPSNGTEVTPGVYATNGTRPLIGSMEGASSMTQPYAAERLTSVLEGPFQEMQRLFGRAITINDAIARQGTSRERETPGSRHFHGDALDLNVSGMSDDELIRLVGSAMQAGFQGFGFGSGILHIDMGNSRAWHYGNDTFAGRPVSELIEMVRNGTMPPPQLATGTSSNAPVDPALGRLISRGVGGDVPLEFDQGEGVARGMVQFGDPATVEQAPQGTSVVTPEQGGQSQGRGAPQGQSTPSTAPEIAALIRTLTGQEVDAEAIQAYLEGLQR